MSGPKRNPDKLNTIGIVVVGICGAVLVYVTIVALEAFYVNDTSEIQTMADYGGQDTTAKVHKASEMTNITQMGVKSGATYAGPCRIRGVIRRGFGQASRPARGFTGTVCSSQASSSRNDSA